MKKSLLPTFLLAAALTRSALALEPLTPDVEPVEFLTLNASIAKGMTPETVMANFGAPNERLNAEVWVYYNFRPSGRPAGERVDTLVVAFQGGRVSHLRLTERAPVVALVNQLRAKGAKPTAVVAKK